MGWESSDRRGRLPADWPKRVAKVCRRAMGACEASEHDPRCDGLGSECDHIIAGDDHSLGNLQWLNAWCHKVKTARDRQAWKRQPEGHPGLI